MSVSRSLADSIKDWHAVNGSSYSCRRIYIFCINQIYKALWGMDVEAVEKLLGCDRNLSRDFMSGEQRKQLEIAESLVMDCIDVGHYHPLKGAVYMARIRRTKF